MPLFLPLALALLAPQESPTVALAPDAEARWVPFELTPTNQIRFTATLDGRPVRAVLDTGLSDTIATRAFADAAGLSASRTQRALAIGGGVEVAWADSGTLAFGGLQRRGGRIGITDMPGEERFGADLLVGSDVLGCCALDIDYDARRFRILASGRLPFAGNAAPLARGPSGVPVGEVALGGRRIRPMIVDTGDGSAVTFSRAAWLSAGWRGGTMTTTIGVGIGGPVVTDTLVVPGLAIAGIAPAETELRIEPDGGYSARAGAAGRIGTGLLMRFRVLLDPRAGRMVLARGAAIDAPVLRSTSGLLLDAAPDRLRVLHVMRGSPAAETGWRPGDEICAADGEPAAGRSVDWSAGAPGRTVRLTLCDGRARNLTLRRFY